jgi:hypothetical protein
MQNFNIKQKLIAILIAGFAAIASVSAQENYPKNGLIFSKEFRAGMDTSTVKQNNTYKDRIPEAFMDRLTFLTDYSLILHLSILR